MHSDFDPDDNFAHSFSADADIDEEAATEALIWQLLLLINPGDDEAAREQLEAWQQAMAGSGGDEDAVDLLREAIDWKSGFHVDEHDTRALVESLDELAARWNLRIDWGVEDPTDDEFLDAADAASLIDTAFDRLREHHYTLWVRETGAGLAGWITRSQDDEALRLVASALGIHVRPGAE